MATYNRPNFLASEVGLKLDTIGLDAVTHATMTVEEVVDGIARKVIKQGTVYSANGISGLVFQDIDVTGTDATHQKASPLMTAGHFINATPALPAVVESATITTFAQHGLFADPVKKDSFTRPY
jgi:hypothetical protein